MASATKVMGWKGGNDHRLQRNKTAEKAGRVQEGHRALETFYFTGSATLFKDLQLVVWAQEIRKSPKHTCSLSLIFAFFCSLPNQITHSLTHNSFIYTSFFTIMTPCYTQFSMWLIIFQFSFFVRIKQWKSNSELVKNTCYLSHSHSCYLSFFPYISNSLSHTHGLTHPSFLNITTPFYTHFSVRLFF